MATGWSLGTPTTPPPPAPAPTPGMWLWLRADAGVTETLGVVSAWADQSGNGRDVTAAPGSQPGYIASAINGLPAIEFDLFDDMRLENFLDNIPTGARQVLCVAQPANQIGGTLLSFRRSSQDWACYLYELSATQYAWSDAVSNIAISGAPVDYSGQPRLIEHIQSGGNALVLRVDGTPITLTTNTTSNETGAAGFVIGNRQPGGTPYTQGWVGLIGEILVYPFQLNAPQQIETNAYLARWF